jgi:hypothetical protein
VCDANAYNEAFGYWYGKGFPTVMLGRMLDKASGSEQKQLKLDLVS